jgi:hypothetical protein
MNPHRKNCLNKGEFPLINSREVSLEVGLP